MPEKIEVTKEFLLRIKEAINQLAGFVDDYDGEHNWIISRIDYLVENK